MSVASFVRPREPSRADLEAEIEALRDRVAELERLAFAGEWTAPLTWDLTPTQERMFGLMLARERVTREQMASALWSLRPECDTPEPRAVDVHMCLLRRKLKRHGIEVRTLWGRGYALDPLVRARLRQGGRALGASMPFDRARRRRGLVGSVIV